MAVSVLVSTISMFISASFIDEHCLICDGKEEPIDFTKEGGLNKVLESNQHIMDFGIVFKQTIYRAWKVLVASIAVILYMCTSGLVTGTVQRVNLKMTLTTSVFLASALAGLICLQIYHAAMVSLYGPGKKCSHGFWWHPFFNTNNDKPKLIADQSDQLLKT